MKKVFIAWAVDHSNDSGVVDCGMFDSVELAIKAVADLGLELAEVETEYIKTKAWTAINRKTRLATCMCITKELANKHAKELLAIGVKCDVVRVTIPADHRENGSFWTTKFNPR